MMILQWFGWPTGCLWINRSLIASSHHLFCLLVQYIQCCTHCSCYFLPPGFIQAGGNTVAGNLPVCYAATKEIIIAVACHEEEFFFLCACCYQGMFGHVFEDSWGFANLEICFISTFCDFKFFQHGILPVIANSLIDYVTSVNNDAYIVSIIVVYMYVLTSLSNHKHMNELCNGIILFFH